MKILLFKPRLLPASYYPPLGLAYLAAVLEKAGHTVKILDLTVAGMSQEDFGRYLTREKPDIIGITCMFTEFQAAVSAASLCKEHQHAVPVVMGGPLPTSVPAAFLEHPDVDMVVIGEGEVTFPELVNSLEQGLPLEGVDGLAYKDAGRMVFNPPREPIADIDTLPFPSRNLLDMDKYFSSFESWFGQGSAIKATNMISSRGCPYGCIFCDRSVFGSKWRGRSATNIVDEMELLVKSYGINGILMNDDMFDLYPQRVHEICDEMDRRGLDISWGINSRVNHAREDLYVRMQRSGCRFVAFGLESGNQEILDFIQKKITIPQVEEAVSMARRLGLRTAGYFMIGMLGEDADKIKQTVKFSQRLPLDSGGFSKVVPLPKTPLYQMAQERGIIGEDDFAMWGNFQDTVSLVPGLSSGQLDRAAEEAYWKFFWSRPSRRLPRFVCSFIGAMFPVIYGGLFKRMDFFLYLNRLRETLRLPLP